MKSIIKKKDNDDHSKYRQRNYSFLKLAKKTESAVLKLEVSV